MSDYFASASRFINAAPQDLFDVVADPRNHRLIDGSRSVNDPLPGAPERLSKGAVFSMAMHRKLDYRMRNLVTEFEEGRVIAWKPLSGHTWRYTFTQMEGGTLVTEEWDARRSWNRWLMKIAKVGTANKKAIVRSLERLEKLVTE